MSTYEFVLRFRLPDPHADPEQHLDALADAGCEDATAGVGQPGRIALDFARESGSALEAVVSAVHAVRAAIPGVELVEASPDLVGLTDVAALFGCSRQNMRKLMTSHPDTFPPAVHEGAAALWHLRQVLEWFGRTQKRQLDAAVVDVAEATMMLNIANATQRLGRGGVPKAILALFA
jgi:hypothetical protein